MALLDLAMPLARMLDPELAHALSVRMLASGMLRPRTPPTDPRLATEVLGLRFKSPIGLAAGFDKNAEVPDAMAGFGFGFVEVGTITPKPQAGNPRPRMFRLVADRAVINRLGFNNQGLEAAAVRLAARRGDGPVAANIGPNRDSEDRIADFEICAARIAPLADLLVLNVSSPNTPGLRDLQGGDPVAEILRRTIAAVRARGAALPVLLKIAPDLDTGEVEAIVEAAAAGGAAGLVIGNTTVSRPVGLRGRHRGEQGGLSGPPLFAPSTRVLAQAAGFARGRLAVVGVGGVSSGADAYAKIRAGADLVELYTALAYDGPGLVRRIHEELAALLDRDGFASVAAAKGADL